MFLFPILVLLKDQNSLVNLSTKLFLTTLFFSTRYAYHFNQACFTNKTKRGIRKRDLGHYQGIYMGEVKFVEIMQNYIARFTQKILVIQAWVADVH